MTCSCTSLCGVVSLVKCNCPLFGLAGASCGETSSSGLPPLLVSCIGDWSNCFGGGEYRSNQVGGVGERVPCCSGGI